FLLTRRLPGAHQGGKWEFPGGKLEAGETAEVGLARELHEELNIEVRGSEPLLCIPHDYADLAILLEVRRISGYVGVPSAMEGQGLAWFGLSELQGLEMPAANRAIARALALPPLYSISPSPERMRDADFVQAVKRVLAK